MYTFYYKFLLKKWFQLAPDSLKSRTSFKDVYRPIYIPLLTPPKKHKKTQRTQQKHIKPLLRKIIPKVLLT